jgi:repressor LexA
VTETDHFRARRHWGAVAAGVPIQVLQQSEERFNFTDMFGGPDHFVLQLRGTSMIEDYIADGDFVVIRQQSTAGNGARVVAMIDNEVTLKKLYQQRGQIVLQPCNGDLERKG